MKLATVIFVVIILTFPIHASSTIPPSINHLHSSLSSSMSLTDQNFVPPMTKKENVAYIIYLLDNAPSHFRFGPEGAQSVLSPAERMVIKQYLFSIMNKINEDESWEQNRSRLNPNLPTYLENPVIHSVE